jgi:hypothetical protein
MVAFRTKNTICILDTTTGDRSVLATAQGRVVGLSIDGRRVAWGEQRRGQNVMDVIRAATLPG